MAEGFSDNPTADPAAMAKSILKRLFDEQELWKLEIEQLYNKMKKLSKPVRRKS
jgi:hypothetical protein